MKEKILVHTCCGPCFLAVWPILKNNYTIIAYFYNPNIFPEKEFLLRKKSFIKIAKKLKIKTIIEKYNQDDFDNAILNHKIKPERCELCWDLRILKTAQKANELKIEKFTTTLLSSIYQNTEKIINIGKKIADTNNLKFINPNFKKYFFQAQKKARIENLYIQKYCGCKFSKRRK